MCARRHPRGMLFRLIGVTQCTASRTADAVDTTQQFTALSGGPAAFWCCRHCTTCRVRHNFGSRSQYSFQVRCSGALRSFVRWFHVCSRDRLSVKDPSGEKPLSFSKCICLPNLISYQFFT
ncbi:hypothetical protein COO60DRAFT_432077 [Scenedesmus sp. NREL 46B-D3]|nr:hypothetical protein COO60DRAFT_432077 [Scenedesmus sp. NREL 46B-D3]